MKILHLFDSLKFLRTIFVAVVAIFAFAPAHADTTAIQSVIAYGKTEQNGTPTPTNPVPIMTNNGSIKVFAGNKWTDVNASVGYIIQAGSIQPNSNYIVSVPILLKAGDYTAGYNYSGSTGGARPFTIWESNAQGDLVGDSSVFNIASPNVGTNTGTFTIDRDMYVRVSWRVNFTDIVVAMTTGIYVDGLTETIRDAAGHKATTQMLLSVGDYKDEQNITTGAITRRVGIKVLDGTEEFRLTSGTFRYELDNFPAGVRLMSNYFKGGVNPSMGVTSMPDLSIKGHGSNAGYVYFKYTEKGTVESFQQWLAEQYAAGTPVIIVYPLATEKPESVAPQSLTTAPVRQTLGAIMNMPIKTILTDNTEIMSGAEELIKIATTKYNEESFEDVQDALTGVFNAVDTVVTQTMNQAQAIDQISTSKQTRPDEGCTAKYCLLVEDEDGTPHWYPIAGADDVEYVLPSGYTELQYIESTGTQYINTGIYATQNTAIETKFINLSDAATTSVMIGDGWNGGKYQFSIVAQTGAPNKIGGLSRSLSNFWTTNREFIVQMNKTGLYVDGELLGWSGSATEFTSTNPLTLLGDPTVSGRGATVKLFYMKIYENDTMVRNFIPAQQGTTVGLYDTVSGHFFTNDGTGTFTAGPDM